MAASAGTTRRAASAKSSNGRVLQAMPRGVTEDTQCGTCSNFMYGCQRSASETTVEVVDTRLMSTLGEVRGSSGAPAAQYQHRCESSRPTFDRALLHWHGEPGRSVNSFLPCG
jgi:hypothetical protein